MSLNNAFLKRIASLLVGVLLGVSAFCQEVPIVSYSVDQDGKVLLEVNSSADHYYILNVRHIEEGPFEISVSLTMGEEGTTIIQEPLGAYPIDHYQVLEYDISDPFDTDGDGYDDITEFSNLPSQSPFSAAEPIDIIDATVAIDTITTFNTLSLQAPVIQFFEFLNGKEFLKFIILDFDSDNPTVYFMNSGTHWLHAEFADWLGVDYLADDVQRGNVVFHPTIPGANGTLGTFAFNYSNNAERSFPTVQRTQELLAANMPIIKNNLAYFVTLNNEGGYYWEEELYEGSRVSVVLESDVYAQVDYLGLNLEEGYGRLRQMDSDDIPGIKDIVIYESIPNLLPRVSGIITSVVQTPLSHVNLRAIQDEIPNAFIRDPLELESIADLLGGFVYFRTEQDGFILREASSEEVNEWFENIRPSAAQEPPLDLSYTSILPLSEIDFDMFDAYGAKCANVATMGNFGFPQNTIPEGYGVPFHFYKEFMEFNGFFDVIREMLEREDFKEDREVRNDLLAILRESIRQAPMPDWIMAQLAEMHASFPEGTSVRCRSSTNNEDLPGFSGAGLYDSKTQHPDEGHISKSIKQVYASLWNLRAFEERDFFRVNHFNSCMGVLCHPNYSLEKVNGVAVSTDPVYGTTNTFYLNSQQGEDLITNPIPNTTPEEILLDKLPGEEDEYFVIQRSNLVPPDSLLMGPESLLEMRGYLTKIHEEFAILYGAERNPTFAMDIEYKISADDQLIIKQARPWVSYVPQGDELFANLKPEKLYLYPNPVEQTLNVRCTECRLDRIVIMDVVGNTLYDSAVDPSNSEKFQFDVSYLSTGVYIISGYSEGQASGISSKFFKL
ncbi:hypothetical protein O3Q51_05225 [Cryomorphaceae bacterium 1068]|nr:hypothetical protein [Cryomorphaceae bacterium 1068]